MAIIPMSVLFQMVSEYQTFDQKVAYTRLNLVQIADHFAIKIWNPD